MINLIAVDLGRWITQARMAAGLTQEQLAVQLGVTRAHLAYWESGEQEPAYRQVLTIQRECGLTTALPGSEMLLPSSDNLAPAEITLLRMFRAQPSRDLRAAVYRLLDDTSS